MQRFRTVDGLLQQFEISVIADGSEQALADWPEIGRVETVAHGLQAVEHLRNEAQLQTLLVLREEPARVRPRICDAQAHQLVGPDAFRRGVSAYLKTHAYGNTTIDDFLSEIGKASGLDLESWAVDWLHRPGTNRVTVDLDCQDGMITGMAILQERLGTGTECGREGRMLRLSA